MLGSGRMAPGGYNLGYPLTQFDVLTALTTQQMRSRNRQVDPAFATALFTNYCQAKLNKGRARGEISIKLSELERGLPQFARSFHEARERTGLPPSPIFPPLRRSVTSTHPHPSQQASSSRLARTNTSIGSNTQGPNVATISRFNVQTTRPGPSTGTGTTGAAGASASASATGATGETTEDLPPPPYSRVDPEPEMTAVLERQMSCVDSNPNRRAVPRPPSTNPNPPVPFSETHTERTGTDRETETERRELERALTESRLSLPALGDPLAPNPNSNLNFHSSAMDANANRGGRRGESEEERERRELEMAIEESRVQAELDERRRSAVQGGGNRVPFPSPGPNQNSTGPLINRRESNPALSNAIASPDQTHRRATSHYIPPPDHPASPSASASGPGPAFGLDHGLQQLNLMDDEPLEPFPTGSARAVGSTNPFIHSSEVVNKNPFLSLGQDVDMERAQGRSQSQGQGLGQGPGSSRTQYNPPSQPPPGWQGGLMRPNPTGNPFLQPQGHLDLDVPPPIAPKPLGPRGGTPGEILSHQLGLGVGTRRDQGAAPVDPEARLRLSDMVILVDDSGSMAGGRWRETRTALMEVAEHAAEFDTDGIDVYFINDPAVGEGMRSGTDVERLFQRVKPGAQTPTGKALDRILTKYMDDLDMCSELERRGELPRGEGIKPMNLIVITDGAPTDDPASVLVRIARRLDQGNYPLTQLRIKLLQIGNEEEAREALQHLDETISPQHGVRDMVDMLQGSLLG